jgi:hypothetical protein
LLPDHPGRDFESHNMAEALPARLARLAWVASIVVTAAATAATTKALSTTFGAVGLWFGFVDGQGATPKVGPIQGCDGLVGFAGAGHFHERETPRSAGFPVGDEGDFFHRPVRLKNLAQFTFGCAMWQIADV